jgi:vacuolar-type H+-ATPase subunit E/Vma4
MPLDHLLAALEREAAAQAEALLAAARAQATEIARDADARLERRRSDLLGSREAELRGAAAAALGAARRASRATVLEARQRLLERVLARARALLPEALASDAYRAALPEHVAQGLRAIGDEPAVIRCPQSLVTAVRAAVRDRKDVSVRGDKASGSGVSIATMDGAIEADNTLDGRLERLRPRLALEVLARRGAAP